MLTSVLPSLRDLRNPLAAGVLLVAVLYVSLAPAVERVHDEDRVGGGLQSLNAQLGERGWLVVGAVASYLLGSLYLTAVRKLMRRLALSQLTAAVSAAALEQESRSLLVRIASPFSRTSVRRIGLLQGDRYDTVTAHNVCVEVLYSGGNRLLSANRDVYDQYDRHKAESEFRDAVAVPGLVFAVVALLDLDLSPGVEGLIIVLVVAATCLLLGEARRLDRIANSVYAHSIADGLISSPYLDDPRRFGRTRWTVTATREPDISPTDTETESAAERAAAVPPGERGTAEHA